MPRPEVGEIAERVYAELGPYAVGDEDQDWHLLRFVNAVTDVLFEQIHLIVSDRGDLVGYEGLHTPSLTPAAAIDYLGQFVGAVLNPSLTEAEKRAAITLPENWKRGGLAAIIQATKRTLTGTQTVIIEERYGDAYGIWIRTLASETPSAAATEAAILTQKPAGLVLTYEAITGQTWSDLIADHATWADVTADYATWQDAITELP